MRDPNIGLPANDYRIIENVVHTRYHTNSEIRSTLAEFEARTGQIATFGYAESEFGFYYNSIKLTSDVGASEENKLKILILSSFFDSVSPLGRLSCCSMPVQTDIASIWRKNIEKLKNFLHLVYTGARGFVRNQANQPIREAFIRLIDHNPVYNVTHNEARFQLILPEGLYALEISAPNYESQIIKLKVKHDDEGEDGIQRHDMDDDEQIKVRYFGSSQVAFRDVKSKLGIVGVPFSKGQTKAGVETAPDLLRQKGLKDILENTSRESPDYKNLKNYGPFMSCNKALIEKIPQILQENEQFLCLGGDHAIGFGSVAGHLIHTPNLSLVWVDAHADINLHSTTASGNIHGMPVAFLLEELRDFWKHAQLDDIAPNW
ncbi:Carboxypeptidase D [Eumeta japonica]|uniref:Carboxypeptidase D n=1 Tax=Eumeta variegata TaxID=151549 RepID=A0A4C1SI14_EUMVA|nr:Carboxypeptidase D [Eumeta japonica]